MGEEEGAAVAVVPRVPSPRVPSIRRLEASRALEGGRCLHRGRVEGELGRRRAEREWVRRGADRERVGEAATMVRGMWVMCFSETLTPSFYIGDGYWASVWVSWASTF